MEELKTGYRGFEILLSDSPYNYDSMNVISAEFICVAGSATIEGMTLVSTPNAPESAKVFKTYEHFNEKLGKYLKINLSGQNARVLVREKFSIA